MTDNLLKVGTLTVAPGGKAVGVEELKIGEQTVRFPIFVVNGALPGPTLAVTAGIHGAEFASIEAALQVGRAITPERLAGRLIIVAVANMPAFLARAIYVCPLDGKNLNRVFPGQGRRHGGRTDRLLAVRERHPPGRLLRGHARRRPDRGAGAVHHLP